MDLQLRICCARGACAILILTCVLPAHADLVTPRVRPVGCRMVSLLARAYAASRTLANLVDALERTDIIVHIEWDRLMHGGPVGETLFVTAAGDQRYLRIYLDPHMRDEMAMAILGHELQHAWEIAQARWVVDQETLARLYTHIGRESQHRPRSRGVDTARAQQVARLVLTEVKTLGGRGLSQLAR